MNRPTIICALILLTGTFSVNCALHDAFQENPNEDDPSFPDSGSDVTPDATDTETSDPEPDTTAPDDTSPPGDTNPSQCDLLSPEQTCDRDWYCTLGFQSSPGDTDTSGDGSSMTPTPICTDTEPGNAGHGEECTNPADCQISTFCFNWKNDDSVSWSKWRCARFCDQTKGERCGTEERCTDSNDILPGDVGFCVPAS